MTSRIIVNNIQSDTGIATVTFNSNISVNGAVSSTGISTFSTLSATNIVGVVTAGITTAYVGSINDGPISGSRNRIINGDCRIDQRNNGSSGTAAGYTVDRWYYYANQASKGTWQRNAGSVTPPVGFTNYLGYTSSSAYTPLSGDIFGLSHIIEGNNISDLAFGTANAKPVTLSFWVRSSLTGQFGGFLKNGGNDVAGSSNRFCGFSYTINSANTWEYKTITFPGDTSGSWDSTTGPGLAVAFSLGSGSTYIGGTPLTWGSTFYQQPSGSINIVQTNGATFYVTGIQLESGTVASAFERRSFGTELALCQRYCAAIIADGSIDNYAPVAIGRWYDSTQFQILIKLPITMRYPPTLNATHSTAANTFAINTAGSFSASVCSSLALNERSYDQVTVTGSSSATGQTAGSATTLYCDNTDFARLVFEAEL